MVCLTSRKGIECSAPEGGKKKGRTPLVTDGSAIKYYYFWGKEEEGGDEGVHVCMYVCMYVCVGRSRRCCVCSVLCALYGLGWMVDGGGGCGVKIFWRGGVFWGEELGGKN